MSSLLKWVAIPILCSRSPAEAGLYQKRAIVVKQNIPGAAGLSADAEANVADGFAAEALFQFSQDVDLGDLFEFGVQSRCPRSCNGCVVTLT
jgi:hypothetical protein